MAHKLRKETDCLNCGAYINGQFCSICGQENIEPKETIWDIIKHFFEDITHYDGQVFSLLKNIFLKPGKVSQEYILGKRKSYINPIRMYIFTSLVFFALVYSVTHNSIQKNKKDFAKGFIIGSSKNDSLKKAEDILFSDSLKKTLKFQLSDSLFTIFKDSIIKINEDKIIDSMFNDNEDLDEVENEKLKNKIKNKNSKKNKNKFSDLGSEILKNKISSEFFVKNIDSFTKAYNLGIFEKRLYKKYVSLAEEKNYNKDDLVVSYFEIAIKNIPNILFLSLPLVALVFSLFFITSKINYAGHIIFIIHQYIMIFIVGIFILATYKLFPQLVNKNLSNIMLTSLTGIVIHFLFAFRRFYGNRWFIIFIKSFLLFFILSFIFILLLFALMLFVAI